MKFLYLSTCCLVFFSTIFYACDERNHKNSSPLESGWLALDNKGEIVEEKKEENSEKYQMILPQDHGIQSAAPETNSPKEDFDFNPDEAIIKDIDEMLNSITDIFTAIYKNCSTIFSNDDV